MDFVVLPKETVEKILFVFDRLPRGQINDLYEEVKTGIRGLAPVENPETQEATNGSNKGSTEQSASGAEEG
jgi:hypothetical protein